MRPISVGDSPSPLLSEGLLAPAPKPSLMRGSVVRGMKLAHCGMVVEVNLHTIPQRAHKGLKIRKSPEGYSQ